LTIAQTAVLRTGKNGKFKYIEKSDPLVHWQIKGDLGSGSYGKVHLVQNRQDRSEAAAKVADIEVEDELYQFTTEIDMLVRAQACRTPSSRLALRWMLCAGVG